MFRNLLKRIPRVDYGTSLMSTPMTSSVSLRTSAISPIRQASTLHRSSSVFTFSTRFPRGSKSLHPSSSSSKTGKKRGRPKAQRSVSAKRLTLANVSSSSTKTSIKASSSSDTKRSRSIAKKRSSTSASNDANGAVEGLQRLAAHQSKFALLNPGVAKDGTADPVQPTKSATLPNKTFAEMSELHPSLLEALSKGFGFEHPSAIQALLLPKFLETSVPKDTLVASETGSGKTLAYLLPLFHSLKTQEETLAKEAESATDAIHQTLDAVMANGQLVSSLNGLAQVRKLGRPRAVILVPSRELVAQVTEVAKTLSHYCKLRVFGMHSRTRPSHVKAALSSAPVDILVSTPGSLQEHLKDSTLAFSQCRHIVLDEADTLLDRGFAPEIQKMVHGARESAKVNKHSFNALFVSATLPKTLVRLLNKDFPNLDTLTTPGLHHAIARVHQSFLKIDSSTTKQNLLLEVLKLDVVKSPRILIFRNTRKGCELLTSFLKSRQYDAQMVTSETRAEERAEIWSSFKAFGNVDKEGCKILVSTDLASRGMDTTSCRHVILYDFPQTAIDYLHRAGRVGRMGRKGRVTSFVGKKDRRLADSIELAIRRRQFLSQ